MLDNKTKKIILLCCLLFLVVLSSFIFADNSKSAKVNVNNETGTETTFVPTKNTNSKKIKVYVTGEVQKPGIYEVAVKTRSLDVIKMAGGFTETADVEKVNLTRILRDGTQIKVPSLKKNVIAKPVALGEPEKKERSFKKGSSPINGTKTQQLQNALVTVLAVEDNTVISLNNADVQELSRLPGIYPELARRIIDYRNQHPFTMIDELLQIKGISPIKFDKIKKYLTL